MRTDVALKPYNFIMRIIFTFLSICALFSACQTEGPIPAYIRANRPVLQTDYATEGSASHKINSLYVYVDGQLIGIRDFQGDSLVLPSIYSGQQEVRFAPAVNDNGSVINKTFYPFYTTYIELRNLVPGQTAVFNPFFTYKPNASFGFKEDFEGTGTLLGKDLDNDPITNVAIVTSNPRDASLPGEIKSGLIQVDTAHRLAKFSTSVGYGIPSSSSNVYLELDYRCTNSFTVGLRPILGSNPPYDLSHILIAPKDNWNKIYLNITNLVKSVNANSFEIFFNVQLDRLENIRGEVQLDNIKLVYFP